MLDFLSNLKTEEHNFQDAYFTARYDGDIPKSTEISGIEIRLCDVKIINNRTPKIPPFPGLANVYLLNIVVSDVATEPVSIDLRGFEKVDDGDNLNIDRVLFHWRKTEDNEVPSQVHVLTSLIKSKAGLRNVGKMMVAAKSDPNYTTLVDTLGSLVKSASSFGSISSAVFQLAGIVGDYLGKVEDKPFLTWVQSFTDLNGDFDTPGRVEKEAKNDNASMKLATTVRDAGDHVPVADGLIAEINGAEPAPLN